MKIEHDQVAVRFWNMYFTQLHKSYKFYNRKVTKVANVAAFKFGFTVVYQILTHRAAGAAEQI